jgi:hypothetical protein
MGQGIFVNFKIWIFSGLFFLGACSSTPAELTQTESEDTGSQEAASGASSGDSALKESSPAEKIVDLNQILKLKRNTPVFSKPSPRSRVLADAYADTVVILRRLSPKQNWAWVEDEDGHKGWIPTNRTNWYDLKTQKTTNEIPPESLPAPESLPPSLEEAMANSEPVEEPKAQSTEASSLAAVLLNLNRKGRGLTLFYLAGSILKDSIRQKLDRTGFEVHALNLWGSQRISTSKDPWVVGASFRMLSQNIGSGLASGPSLGGLFRIDNKTWGPSIAYSAGFLPPEESGPVVQGRAAFEWIDWDMEFNFGVEIGWAF